MKDPSARDRGAASFRRRRPMRPTLEGLEDRMLLYAVTGDHFTYGSRITWSIMPDGTNIGGPSSNFNATMNAKFGQGNWLPIIQDAFAEWENASNVNFAQVSDDGSAFGSGNYQQDSPEFGDIRIGGMAQDPSVLAFTILPPKANGGSDSGDIFLNTNQAWHIGSDYDLETVLKHEIGHALGMGHSTDVNAVMFGYYGGAQGYLGSDDVAGVQSIWGARQEDLFVQNFGNLTIAKAANVTGFMNNSNDQVYLPGLTVASPAEGYWFKVTTPANSSYVFTAQVQSTNLSELSPRVQIYNAAGVGLVQTSAPASSFGATINATITNATPNTTYYIKVLGSNAGSSGTGAYAMTIDMGFQYIATAPPPNTVVYAQPDQGGGVDQIEAGGVGSWIKEYIHSGHVPDFSSLGLQPDPAINAAVKLIANDLSTLGAQATADLDAALLDLLQVVPEDVLDGSAFWMPWTTGGNPTRVSPAKIEAMLLPVLADLSNFLVGDE